MGLSPVRPAIFTEYGEVVGGGEIREAASFLFGVNRFP